MYENSKENQLTILHCLSHVSNCSKIKINCPLDTRNMTISHSQMVLKEALIVLSQIDTYTDNCRFNFVKL